MKVYLLQHMYEYGDNLQHEEIKTIGIYSSRQKAEKVVDIYQDLPGFSTRGVECFYIDEYEIDQDHWSEGFFSADEEHA